METVLEFVNERLGVCVDDLVTKLLVGKEDLVKVRSVDGLKLFVTEGDTIKVGETVELIDETSSGI